MVTERVNEREDDETRAAAEQASRGDPAGDVRAWLLEATSGTLCSVSSHDGVEGFPFGSIVPFAVDKTGRPVILIANIAAHTKNLVQDDRASLFVHQPGLEGDPQTGWRVTLMGRWERLVAEGEEAKGPCAHVGEAELEELDARYRERVPASEGYRSTHDFCFWRLSELARVRYIAGFGRICWVKPGEVLRDPAGGGLTDAAPGAIAHMNEDHRHNMVEMCEGLAGFRPDDAEMVGLDRAGMLIRTQGPNRLVHFSFGREIRGDEVRPMVIEVLQRARARTQA